MSEVWWHRPRWCAPPGGIVSGLQRGGLVQAVSQIGNQDGQLESDLDERARRTQSQLGELLGEVACALTEFEAKLEGAPALDGLLQVEGTCTC